MKRIVVGFDGSEHARKALERAADLAGDDTTLAIVSAADVMRPLAGTVSPTDPGDAEDRADALAEARRFVEDRGLEATFIEGHGNPAEVIVEEAEQSGADLIVVGTRGLSTAKRILLGSVSTHVVHNAPCDVFVVR